MKSTKLMATLLVAGMLFTGCGVKNSQVIIKINDTLVTENDFNKIMDKQIANTPLSKMGMDIKSDKNGIMYKMTARSTVTQLIIEELLDQEAEARGITVSNDDVNDAINDIIEKLGGKDNLSKLLKQNNVSIKQFKSDIRTQVKMKKLARSAGDINVSDKEVKDFYDKNIDKFKHGEQVRASHILLIADPEQLKADIKSNAKQELSEEEISKRVKDKVKENEDFANKLADELKSDKTKFSAYAKQYSQDTASAERGGDLGYFEAKTMVPEFSKAAFGAKPNTVVGPVKTQFGYHIIYIIDRKAAGTESFDKVKNNLKESLTNEKELKALDDLVNAAKKKANIEFIDKQYDPEELTKQITSQLSGVEQEKDQDKNKSKDSNKPTTPVKK